MQNRTISYTKTKQKQNVIDISIKIIFRNLQDLKFVFGVSSKTYPGRLVIFNTTFDRYKRKTKHTYF